MKGHIRERSPGHWAIVLDIRDPETGKRRRKWHNFAGTKREAQVECARRVAELAGGGYVEPKATTLASFLDRWLEHVRTQVSPRTFERYSELARKNIAPYSATRLCRNSSPYLSHELTPRRSWRAVGMAGAAYRHAPCIICTGYSDKPCSRPFAGRSCPAIQPKWSSHHGWNAPKAAPCPPNRQPSCSAPSRIAASIGQP
jgi:hypothetical protein